LEFPQRTFFLSFQEAPEGFWKWFFNDFSFSFSPIPMRYHSFWVERLTAPPTLQGTDAYLQFLRIRGDLPFSCFCSFLISLLKIDEGLFTLLSWVLPLPKNCLEVELLETLLPSSLIPSKVRRPTVRNQTSYVP